MSKALYLLNEQRFLFSLWQSNFLFALAAISSQSMIWITNPMLSFPIPLLCSLLSVWCLMSRWRFAFGDEIVPRQAFPKLGEDLFQIQNVTDLRLVCVHITVHMTYVAFKLMNIYEDWIWISISRMERQRGGAKFRQTTTGAQLRRKREERGQVSFTPSWSWSWCSKELFPIKAPMLSGN